jgi:Icc protein
VASSVLRVLHVTDPHLFAAADGTLRGTNTHRTFARTLAHYEASDWRADLVLATGDLIQDDSAAAYVRFRELLGALGLPSYCTPGNHDVRALMRDALDTAPFHYCASHTSNGWQLIGIDSCIHGQAGGAVSEIEIERCEQAIQSSDAGNVLVALHHPPVALGSTWLDSVGLANGDEFIQRLESTGRVRLVIFGHAHQAHDSITRNIRLLGTPSTCRQFKPGSDKFTLDDRPPAYRKIELFEDGAFTTELVWIDVD